MIFNPHTYNRKSIRLKGHDYTCPGYYFLTLLVKNRACVLSEINNKKVILSEIGKIANECWLSIPEHFPNTKLGEYVIMPNHIHGIIEIVETIAPIDPNETTKRATESVAPTLSLKPKGPKPKSIGSIIGQFKSVVSKKIKQQKDDRIRLTDPVTPFSNVWTGWHRDYHDRIIRNQEELYRIRTYIINNPKNWDKEKM